MRCKSVRPVAEKGVCGVDDQEGTLPEMVFWERGDGRLQLIRHCDGVFSLLLDGIAVMPSGTFERLCRYMWKEFDMLNDIAIEWLN